MEKTAETFNPFLIYYQKQYKHLKQIFDVIIFISLDVQPTCSALPREIERKQEEKGNFLFSFLD